MEYEDLGIQVGQRAFYEAASGAWLGTTPANSVLGTSLKVGDFLFYPDPDFNPTLIGQITNIEG